MPSDESQRELLRERVVFEPRDYAAEMRDELCKDKKAKQHCESDPSEKIYNRMSYKQFTELLDYCGEGSEFVDPQLSPEDIIESLKKIILDKTACAPPRVPYNEEKLRVKLMKKSSKNPTIDDICKEEVRVAKQKEPPASVDTYPENVESIEFNASGIKISDKIDVTRSHEGSDDTSCTQVFPWKARIQKAKRADQIQTLLAKTKPSSSSNFDSLSLPSFD